MQVKQLMATLYARLQAADHSLLTADDDVGNQEWEP